MFTIKFHSVIDVITNSSTEIYSWYDESIGACKEMLEEIFKVFGVDKPVDEVFHITLGFDNYVYIDFIDRQSDEDVNELFPGYLDKSWKEKAEIVTAFIKRVSDGEIEKPKWMESAETEEDRNTYREPTNDFMIYAKSPEYNDLAKKIEKFIYSPNHDAAYNG